MTIARTGDQVGVAFARLLAAKDTEGLVALFRPDVDFRGMTPGRFWQAHSPQALADEVFSSWFDQDDIVEEVESVSTDRVVDRWRLDYQFRVRCPDGFYRVEQRAYYDLDDHGLISKMNAICSGFRRLPEE